MNLQNLPRPGTLEDGKTPDPATGRLRRALRAPKGKVVVVADSSQIEARTLAWLAGQTDVLDTFRARGDVYKNMAVKLFGVKYEDVTKDQRFIAKVVVLACGYGMGPQRLQDTLANAKPNPVFATIEQCVDWIHAYREANNFIARFWKECQRTIPLMQLKTCKIERGPITFMHECIRLPNGLFLRYPGMMCQVADYDHGIGEASYEGRHTKRVKLYGGLLAENLTQALARCAIAENILTLSRMGHRVVTSTHDEIVVVTTARKAEKTFQTMIEVMSTPPLWAPDLPLAAEGGYAENYSK